MHNTQTSRQNIETRLFYLRYKDRRYICAFELTQLEKNRYRFSRWFGFGTERETVECGEQQKEYLFHCLDSNQLSDLCREINDSDNDRTHGVDTPFLVYIPSQSIDYEFDHFAYPALKNDQVQLRIANILIQLCALFTHIEQRAGSGDALSHDRGPEVLRNLYF